MQFEKSNKNSYELNVLRTEWNIKKKNTEDAHAQHTHAHTKMKKDWAIHKPSQTIQEIIYILFLILFPIIRMRFSVGLFHRISICSFDTWAATTK